MKLIIYGLSFLLLSTPAVASLQCSTEITAYIPQLKQILSAKDEWNGFNSKTLKFGLIDSRNLGTLVFQIDEKDVFSAGITSETCNEQSELLFLSNQTSELPLNGLYKFIMPGQPGASTDPFVAIGAIIKKAFVILALPPTIPQLSSPIVVARTALHESFHSVFQFGGGFTFETSQPRDYLADCLKNSEWKSQIQEELKTFRTLIDQPNLSIGELKAFSKIFLSIRDSELISAPLCVAGTRFWERIEGSAHYIETRGALDSHLVMQNDLVKEYQYLLSTNDINPSFFYATGDLLIQILNSLDPKKNWQMKINKGLSPEEVLREYINP